MYFKENLFMWYPGMNHTSMTVNIHLIITTKYFVLVGGRVGGQYSMVQYNDPWLIIVKNIIAN